MSSSVPSHPRPLTSRAPEKAAPRLTPEAKQAALEAAQAAKSSDRTALSHRLDAWKADEPDPDQADGVASQILAAFDGNLTSVLVDYEGNLPYVGEQLLVHRRPQPEPETKGGMPVAADDQMSHPAPEEPFSLERTFSSRLFAGGMAAVPTSVPVGALPPPPKGPKPAASASTTSTSSLPGTSAGTSTGAVAVAAAGPGRKRFDNQPTRPGAPSGSFAFGAAAEKISFNDQEFVPLDPYIQRNAKGGIEWGFSRPPLEDESDFRVTIMSVAPENEPKFCKALAGWLHADPATKAPGLLGLLSARAGTPGTGYNIGTFCAMLKEKKVPFA